MHSRRRKLNVVHERKEDARYRKYRDSRTAKADRWASKYASFIQVAVTDRNYDRRRRSRGLSEVHADSPSQQAKPTVAREGHEGDSRTSHGSGTIDASLKTGFDAKRMPVEECGNNNDIGNQQGHDSAEPASDICWDSGANIKFDGPLLANVPERVLRDFLWRNAGMLHARVIRPDPPACPRVLAHVSWTTETGVYRPVRWLRKERVDGALLPVFGMLFY
jgi:hypothetical protein